MPTHLPEGGVLASFSPHCEKSLTLVQIFRGQALQVAALSARLFLEFIFKGKADKAAA